MMDYRKSRKARSLLRAYRKQLSGGGFSLLELSVSLMVLSLLLGGALTIASERVKKRHIETDEEKLAVIQTALEAFKTREGRFPCVAERTAVPGDATLGREILYVESPAADCSTDSTAPAGTLRVESTPGSGEYVRIGAVPTRDLGLRDEYLYDSYGNRFTYVVMERLTNEPWFDFVTGIITVNDGAGVGITTDGAYAVIAHGKDGKGAYTHDLGSERKACGASDNLDVENCDSDGILTEGLYNDGSVEDKYFDDRLVWASKSQLMNGIEVPPEPKFTYVEYDHNSWWGYAAYNFIGDVNGDGYGDIFTSRGTFVRYGEADMPNLITYNGDADVTLTGNPVHYAAGDLNGDNIKDILLRPHSSSPISIIFGDDDADGPYGTGTKDMTTLAAAPSGFQITIPIDSFYRIGSADVNDDGIDDLLAWRGEGAGEAYIIFGRENFAAGISVAAPDGVSSVKITGSTANSGWGQHYWVNRSMASGDMDGDGYDDVFISTGEDSNLSTNHGWIIFGNKKWPAEVDLADYLP